MKIPSTQLILELQQLTRQHIVSAKSLQQQDLRLLNWRKTNDSWSILECIEHLNRYGYFYLPAINSSMHLSTSRPAPFFKSGIIGNYFVQMIIPGGKGGKMKTPKPMNPIHQQLTQTVIDTFIQQQETMLSLLQDAKSVNLNQIRTSIGLTKWIKLKLGDTFRFVIYHNMRHLKQVENILNAQGSFSGSYIAAI